ncbi:O-antigen polymerase [Heyndrickxia coagulans]|uniref:O-antigen polymerase n=1 Tax=Heyndrickxia coagulans TaxID=1398 RepID=UPI000E4AF87B|nr:O-antigen polymerase [Heyndrickxia coagulans]RGR95830.1 hypothetical protein DWY16_12405 [Heyndrickxia coagulans]
MLKRTTFFNPNFYIFINIVTVFIMLTIPKEIYKYYLLEPKFINFSVFLYIALSSICFIMGYRFSPNFYISSTIKEIPNKDLLIKAISILLFFMILTNVYVIIKFSSVMPISSIISSYNQGAFTTGGVFDAYQYAVTGVSWFLICSIPLVNISFWIKWHNKTGILFNILLYSCTVISLIRPAIRGDRGVLLGSIFSLFILYVFYKFTIKKLNIFKLAVYLSLVLFFGLSIFTVYQYSRFNTTDRPTYFIISQIFGYYAGSYNRFGYQLTYHAPFLQSNGYYIFQFLYDLPILNKIIPLEGFVRNITGYVPPISTFWLWLSEGLNPNFNVLSGYGDTFVDFHWFGSLFFIFYGILAKTIFTSFLKKTYFGIMAYPIFIWDLLELRGKLEVVYYNFVSIIIFSFILGLLLDYTSKVANLNNGQSSNNNN